MTPTVYLYLGLALVILAGFWITRHGGDAEVHVRLDPDWQDKESLATIEREDAHGIIHTQTIRRIATSGYRQKDKPSGVRSGYTRNR